MGRRGKPKGGQGLPKGTGRADTGTPPTGTPPTGTQAADTHGGTRPTGTHGAGSGPTGSGPSDSGPTGSGPSDSGRPSDEPAAPPRAGRAERRKLARKVKRRRRRSAIKEIPLLLGVAVLIALVLKTFLVQAFVIPSGSMEQTIKIGDRVLVDKLTPWFGAEPQRGDVVVFQDPGGWLRAEQQPQTADDPIGVKQFKQALTFIGLLPSADEQDLIKRVVAVGGDRVKCCGQDGRVTVNGVALNEPYLHPDDINQPSQRTFDVKVPEGRIFVMGDHRSDSADSRYHLDSPYQGTVSQDQVVGTAKVIAWPVDHWSELEQRETYASVPDAVDARGDSDAADSRSHRVAPENLNANVPLPTPAELPLVMGVVGLQRVRRHARHRLRHRLRHRVRDAVRSRQRHGTRSGCGGFGRRRTIRTRRTRG
ncbi:signal peptidase I [Streptomyces sp. B-S-A8]|uniref:Signal peptidase I n=1 Tax=Streptomyces solicavernae TaxID=3043614 RepID=A0ABT6RVD6_9ACTN|nr:signal peptidase I [Streptomyces sp. B-S-A8]MDI3388394.1 signal peptidase I [Streptomyces sp. B-S-A8]